MTESPTIRSNDRVGDLERVNAACQATNAKLLRLKAHVEHAERTCRWWYLIPGGPMRRALREWLDDVADTPSLPPR